MAHNSSGLIEQFFVKNNMYNMFICSLPELDAGLYAHDNSEARLREVLDQSREELRTDECLIEGSSGSAGPPVKHFFLQTNELH